MSNLSIPSPLIPQFFHLSPHHSIYSSLSLLHSWNPHLSIPPFRTFSLHPFYLSISHLSIPSPFIPLHFHLSLHPSFVPSLRPNCFSIMRPSPIHRFIPPPLMPHPSIMPSCPFQWLTLSSNQSPVSGLNLFSLCNKSVLANDVT